MLNSSLVQPTSPNDSAKFRSDDEVGNTEGISGDTVRNIISLNNLVPELMEMVDKGKMALTPAYQIASLSEPEQRLLVKPSTVNRQRPPFHRHSG